MFSTGKEKSHLPLNCPGIICESAPAQVHNSEKGFGSIGCVSTPLPQFSSLIYSVQISPASFRIEVSCVKFPLQVSFLICKLLNLAGEFGLRNLNSLGKVNVIQGPLNHLLVI